MKRKYLNPGFQPRALHAYEDRMKGDILNLKAAFLEKTSHGETRLDFGAWGMNSYL
jgi:cytochrome P450